MISSSIVYYLVMIEERRVRRVAAGACFYCGWNYTPLASFGRRVPVSLYLREKREGKSNKCISCIGMMRRQFYGNGLSGESVKGAES